MPTSAPKPPHEVTTESHSHDPRQDLTKVTFPALTVLYHSDLGRVGEQSLLTHLAGGRSQHLSRLEPIFGVLEGTREPMPLDDRRISRRPFLLETVSGGIRLRCGESRTQIFANGEPIETERLFKTTDLTRGIVLLLGGRVVLLLHYVNPYPESIFPDYGLIGRSSAIATVRRDISQVADLDIPVFIEGETGTGKELVAQALHASSRRCQRPFLAINMAAVPPSLAAAELFGAARGAFTGAERQREGFFERADGGTLFLDEVGEMPVEVQTLLLRCLESGEIQPVGGSEPRKVDVRVVAATDSDLEAAISEGRFRAPLLHRLGSFRIRLPPLRDRREDIGRLLVFFLSRELATIGESKRLQSESPWLPAHLVARAAQYDWPGNVRQLRNVIRQIVITHRGCDSVRHDALRPLIEERPSSLGTSTRRYQEATVPEPTGEEAPKPLDAIKPTREPSDISEEELLDALRNHRWRPYAAARHLGIPRPSIYRIMRRSPRIRIATDLSPAELETAQARYGEDVVSMADELQVSERALRRRLRRLGLL